MVRHCLCFDLTQGNNYSPPFWGGVHVITINQCRSQWPRGLKRRSVAPRLLRSRVRIPPGAWMFVCCECCVLSGRGLCDELITRPEESYRLWCVVLCDLENLKNEEVMTRGGLQRYRKKKINQWHKSWRINSESRVLDGWVVQFIFLQAYKILTNWFLKNLIILPTRSQFFAPLWSSCSAAFWKARIITQ